MKKIPTINIREAKTQLSRLVDQAAQGKSFIIARRGKPLVKVTAIDAPGPSKIRRIGFLKGLISLPDDFDTMGSSEIARSFEDEEGS
jgi:prevent-host-death family protein